MPEVNNSKCEARRTHDEMQCGRCGLCWGIDDPEPPTCRRDDNEGHETLRRLKNLLN